MYSQEMHEWLEQRNYSLTAEEYMYITDLAEHPQISAIEHKPWDDCYELRTNDGYKWTMTIK